MRRLVLAAACLAALAAPAEAELRQHGDVVYDLPPGWSANGVRDGIHYVAVGPGSPCHSCAVGLGLPEPAEGPVEDWLAAEALGYVWPDWRPLAVVTKPPRVVATEPRTLAATTLDVNGYVVVAYAVEVEGHYQFLAFEGATTDDAARAQALAFLQAEVRPFFDALRYVSEGAEPVLPPAEPGGMSGLLWGWFSMPGFGLDMMIDTTTIYRRLVFWPDGRFYEGTPPTGTEPLDPDALAAAGDPNWGVYREAEGMLDLHFADGRAERLQPMDVEGVRWDGVFVLFPVEALEDGAALDGTIGWADFEGLSPFGDVQGGVSSGASTTFRPDGTYEGSSFDYATVTLRETDGDMNNATGDVTGGAAAGGEAPGSRGTYEVRDGLVAMTPADGSPPSAEMAFRVQGDIWIGDLQLDGR